MSQSIIFNARTSDDVNKINLATDIVVCCKEEEQWIRANIDGSIDIVPPKTLNLSPIIRIDGYTSHLKQIVPVKMYIPFGIKPVLKKPDNQSYMEVYPYYNKIDGFILKKEIISKDKIIPVYSELSDYSIYQLTSIGFNINIPQMKKENQKQIFNYEHILANLLFVNTFPKFYTGNIIFCINNDIYNLHIL